MWRNLLFSALGLLSFGASIQAQSLGRCEQRYLEPIFNQVQVFRNVVYSKDAPKLFSSVLDVEVLVDRDLVMDIYMPPASDQVNNRPLVILAHGGGFVDVVLMGGTILVGTKDNEDIQALADSLARRGFVTASIEYRTGFDVLSSTSITRAVWRGSQDMSAAIRFFRKNAAWFGIDPNRVFIGGSSAGAFASLHATFVDFQERVPESYAQGLGIGMGDLGAMHSRPVVELSNINPFTGDNVLGNDVDSIANGLVAFWGAIADTAFFRGNNTCPVLMFHGTNDLIVDAECARPFSSLIFVAPVTCGTIVMDSALNRLGMPHETQIEQGEGHEYWGALNGMWMSSGPNAFWRPMIDQTGQFFYEIMRPAQPTVQGPTQVPNETVRTYSVQNPQAGMNYCWRVENGVIVSPPPHNGSSVQVRFFAGYSQGRVQVQAEDAAKVYSQPSQLVVNLSPLVTGLDELSSPLAAEFKIQPNPSAQAPWLSLENGASGRYELEVYNLLGARLQGYNLDFPGLDTPVQVQGLGELSPGIYLLRLRHQASGYTQTLRWQKY